MKQKDRWTQTEAQERGPKGVHKYQDESDCEELHSRSDRHARMQPPSLIIGPRFVGELMDLPDDDLCTIMRTLLALASGNQAMDPELLTEDGWVVYDELQPAVARNIRRYLEAQQDALTMRLRQLDA